jgi:predicted nucleic acid-binding Zn ribbon protein
MRQTLVNVVPGSRIVPSGYVSPTKTALAVQNSMGPLGGVFVISAVDGAEGIIVVSTLACGVIVARTLRLATLVNEFCACTVCATAVDIRSSFCAGLLQAPKKSRRIAMAMWVLIFFKSDIGFPFFIP